MTVDVGLVGFGVAGASFHAPLIGAVERLRLVAVATSRCAAVRGAWPDAAVVPDIDTLLADPAIGLIVIATPNESHAPLARQALSAGKHVVIDKPFAVDVADGSGLIDLARARGLMLTVFHNRRWDADFLTVQDVLRGNMLREIALVECRWDRFRPAIRPGWREEAGPGTGLLNDLGPHLVDQAMVLFGWPDALSAEILTQRAGGRADDYFDVTLHYGARRVILSAASLLAAPRPRFALHGTGGSYVKHGIDPQEAVLRAGGRPADSGYGIEPSTAWGVLTPATGEPRAVATRRGDWRCFYEGVADAIVGQAPPPIDPVDALAGLRLIALARQSAAEGRTLPCPS